MKTNHDESAMLELAISTCNNIEHTLNGGRFLPLPEIMGLIANACRDYHEHMSAVHPISEWHDDDGDVLCHEFPPCEPPTVTSPLCSDWDDRFTHFQRLPLLTGKMIDGAEE